MPSSKKPTGDLQIQPFQKPKCLALVLCEQIIEDKRSHNKSMIDIFSRINGQKLPLIYPRFFIYVSLSGGRGVVPVDIEITGLHTGIVVMKMTGKAAFGDPLAVTDLVLECRNVPFKDAGVYAINVTCNGDMIAERRFDVTISESKQQNL